MLKINEIFHSIQGESTLAGLPTVFVRLTGCHLRCNYCDTKYSYFEGSKMELEEVIEKIISYDCENVCVTGGEPLLQKECFSLLDQLCERGFSVSLETSGAVDISKVHPKVKTILDVKTKDSGEAGSFLESNLDHVNVNTEFKFVICSEDDFHWAEEFSRKYKIFDSHVVLYSPAYKDVSEKWLANKILSQRSKARLQMQLHKYIWSEHERGV